MTIFPENLSLLPPYRVEQKVPRIKLNQNEAPFDVPLRLKREILIRLQKQSWRRYPPAESPSLLQKLSDYYGVPPSGILVGNGSNELIQALLLAVCGRGGTLLTVQPGFAVYERTAFLTPARVLKVPLASDLGFDVPALLKKAPFSRLVFLSSPHNPTGASLEAEEVESLAEAVPGLLVVDEAYAEFHGQSLIPLIRRRRNLAVLRTFSKAWRLAGARLGCLLGRPETIRNVAKAKLPFSVNIFALTAADVLLDYREELDRLQRTVIKERDRVFRSLKSLKGVCPIPSSANFILFKMLRRTASSVYRALRTAGVEVRAFTDPALRCHLRVTIGTPEENNIFLSVLRKIFERTPS